MIECAPMRWKTRITEMLGIQYPIVEGAMVGIGNVELAAAVDVVTVKELIEKIVGESEEILSSGGIGGWKFSG